MGSASSCPREASTSTTSASATPSPRRPVVLAVHGITANGLSWLCVAEELFRRRGPGSVRFLAPTCAGGRAAGTRRGPTVSATHADDVLAIADVFGTRPVLVGHSMGAFVTALASARAPERVAGSVLVDGGFAFPPPAEFDIDAALTAVIGPAMTRLSMRFAEPRGIPRLLAGASGARPGARAGRRRPRCGSTRYTTSSRRTQGDWVSSCVLEAIRADGADVLADPETHAARRQARWPPASPTEFLWAPRGTAERGPGALRRGPDRRAGPAGGRSGHADRGRQPLHGRLRASNGTAAVVDAIERRLDGTAGGVSGA